MKMASLKKYSDADMGISIQVIDGLKISFNVSAIMEKLYWAQISVLTRTFYFSVRPAESHSILFLNFKIHIATILP